MKISIENRIIELNGGEAPLTYNQFQAIVASMDSPVAAVPTVTLEHLKNVFTPISEDHDEKYGVPTLFELGKWITFNNSHKREACLSFA